MILVVIGKVIKTKSSCPGDPLYIHRETDLPG